MCTGTGDDYREKSVITGVFLANGTHSCLMAGCIFTWFDCWKAFSCCAKQLGYLELSVLIVFEFLGGGPVLVFCQRSVEFWRPCCGISQNGYISAVQENAPLFWSVCYFQIARLWLNVFVMVMHWVCIASGQRLAIHLWLNACVTVVHWGCIPSGQTCAPVFECVSRLCIEVAFY